MFLIPIPAFADNYLWLLHDGKRAVVVDPGDAGPVQRTLEKHALQLESILVTRRHQAAHHTAGIDELRDATGAPVFGPAAELIPQPRVPLRANGHPTLPSSIARELRVNPFLRIRQATIMASAQRFDASVHDDITAFAAIRQWKT